MNTCILVVSISIIWFCVGYILGRSKKNDKAHFEHRLNIEKKLIDLENRLNLHK